MVGEVSGKCNTESCLWIVISVLWIRRGSKRLQAQRAAGFVWYCLGRLKGRLVTMQDSENRGIGGDWARLARPGWPRPGWPGPVLARPGWPGPVGPGPVGRLGWSLISFIIIFIIFLVKFENRLVCLFPSFLHVFTSALRLFCFSYELRAC